MSKRKMPQTLGGAAAEAPLPPPIAQPEEVPSDDAIAKKIRTAACQSSDDSPPLSPHASRPPGIYPQPEAAPEPQSPTRRVIPQGSPAAAFIRGPGPGSPDNTVLDLTCDLNAVPKDKWNKRRTLSAVIIAVLPIKTKATTIRRNVVLRDQHGECVVCVWGNHTQLINESAIGRPITCVRVCLQEFESVVQVALPKDSSINLGATPKTAPITTWIQHQGNQVLTVPQAIALQQSSIIAIHGIVAQVISETITTKDGKVLPLTTVSIASGPPNAVVPIQFWHAKPDQVAAWTDMEHQAVDVIMIRCQVHGQHGNKYESIGNLTIIRQQKDQTLETWWFKPE